MIWSDATFHKYGPSIFSPYSHEQIRQVNGTPVKSYGQSGSGYDLCASSNWRVPSNLPSRHVVDLRQPGSVEAAWRCVEADELLLPPGGIVLVESQEHITMPATSMALAVGKSTDARRGINIYITPLEAGWIGHLVIEIVNHSPHHQVIRAGEGIVQLIFYWIDFPPIVSYDQRPSLYQGQSGVALARLV